MVPPVSSDHEVPFHRRITACSPPVLTADGIPVPTAITSLADRAATPVNRVTKTPFSAGLGTMVHALPFQFSSSGVPLRPTAHALVGEMAVTAVIAGVPAVGCAIGTTDHAVPLKCSASATVCPVDAANDVPTTQ